MGNEQFVVIDKLCVCKHSVSDHETAGRECAYGWTGEPGEEPCECTSYEFAVEVVG